MNKKIKHLEMIQKIISRMSGNLFLLKGWTVTLILGVFTLLVKNLNNYSIIFPFCVLFIFWLLDGFFLSMERRFRCLYNEVRTKDESEIDFNMDCNKFHNGRNTWFRAFFSKTLIIFYGSILVMLVLLIVFR